MIFHCLTCGTAYLPENINVQTDLALCQGCGQMGRLSELADAAFESDALDNPPKGTWYQETLSGTVIGATTRSPIAFFLVPFMCVWSGFSLGGIYGGQIMRGEFNLAMSLFGIPFLLGSVLFWTLTLMAICGKLEVKLRDRQGIIFVGLGALGWKRRINLDEVTSITEEGWMMNYPGARGAGIVLKGKSQMRFGTNLTEARREFVKNALKVVKARRS